MIGFKACLELGFHSAGDAGQRSTATNFVQPFQQFSPSFADGTAPLRPSPKPPKKTIALDALGEFLRKANCHRSLGFGCFFERALSGLETSFRLFIGNAPRHVQPGFLRASVICGMDRPSCPTFIFDSKGAITLERIFPTLRKGVFSGFCGTLVAIGGWLVKLREFPISAFPNFFSRSPVIS